jgi:hypothetical protein
MQNGIECYKTSKRDEIMQFTDLITPALAYATANRQRSGVALPNLTVLQTMEVSEFDAVVYKPVVCLVLQGAKETTIGDQSLPCAPAARSLSATIFPFNRKSFPHRRTRPIWR